MKTIQLIIAIALLSACDQKSKSELLIGEWKIVSWITNNKYTNNKDKEMVESDEFSISIKFEKDSLRLIEKSKIETYKYYLSDDTILIPKDALGGFYIIKDINHTDLHLYEHKTFEMQDGELIETSSNIKLNKKER